MNLRSLAKKSIAAIAAVTIGAGLLPATASALENGRLADPNSLESKTTVFVYSTSGWACTGVAIDKYWVLTAKHCLGNEQTEYRLTPGVKRSGTQYMGSNSLPAPRSDVGLIRVPDGLDLECYAPVATALPAVGSKGRTYGWGVGTGEDLLMANTTFLKTYNDGNYNAGNMIHVRNEDGKVTRAGDSGGPLFIGGKVVGTASSTFGDERANYGHVPDWSQWIAEQVNSYPADRVKRANPTGLCAPDYLPPREQPAPSPGTSTNGFAVTAPEDAQADQSTSTDQSSSGDQANAAEQSGPSGSNEHGFAQNSSTVPRVDGVLSTDHSVLEQILSAFTWLPDMLLKILNWIISLFAGPQFLDNTYTGKGLF